jgi:signal peptidase I
MWGRIFPGIVRGGLTYTAGTAAGIRGIVASEGASPRMNETAARPRRWRLPLLGAVVIGLLFGGAGLVQAHVLEPFRSPTATMTPTLVIGDRFFVDKRKRPVRRGDVVAFRVPPRLSAGYDLRVKRAVAIAGDTVEMRAGTLLVNGTAVGARRVGTVALDGEAYEEWEETIEARRYRVYRAPGGPRASFGPVTVPEGHFFMLGDNRDRNNDSRLYRAMPLGSVIGRAIWIWWSRAPGGDVRWGRIGRRL